MPWNRENMVKKRRTSKNLVPFVLCAMGVSTFIYGGCSKVEGDSPAPVVEAKTGMKDPSFKHAMDSQDEARKELAKARNVVVERMTEMIEAKKKELGTVDEAKLKAALEKDPEWVSLQKRCLDANQAIKDNQLKTMSVVREQLKSRKATEGKISK